MHKTIMNTPLTGCCEGLFLRLNLFSSMASATFVQRHLGPRDEEQQHMLSATGHDSMAALISRTVPQAILSDGPMAVPEAMSRVPTWST